MDILDKIINAGIVGAGGAGFPTHVKYSAETEYFILNAAECEPLIHSDKYLIRTRAKDIVVTMQKVAEHIKATKLIIAIKKTYTEEIESLQKEIKDNSISLCLMKSFYPAGDEQVIIFEATGKQVPIGKLPKDVGVTVSNISTICDIADACKDAPKTEKVLSIIGAVKNPSIVTAPIGTKVMDCLNAVGLLDAESTLIIGGPMMGNVLSLEEAKNQVITKTVNSLIVLPKDHYVLKRKEMPLEHMINQSLSACIQCRQCTDLCPRFLLGHPLHPHRIMRSIANGNIQENAVFEEALMCCGCGLCSYVCPMGLSPRSINQYVKGELAGKKRQQGELRNTGAFREYRKVPSSRLMNMLDIQQFKHQKPKSCLTIEPKEVTIPLKQHIGKKSTAIVSVGDVVRQGSLIAGIAENALGAKIHASINGTITSVTNESIIIQRAEG